MERRNYRWIKDGPALAIVRDEGVEVLSNSFVKTRVNFVVSLTLQRSHRLFGRSFVWSIDDYNTSLLI